MKPDTISTACSVILVGCVALCVSLRALGVEPFTPYGALMLVGTVAAIIGARQPA